MVKTTILIDMYLNYQETIISIGVFNGKFNTGN